MDAYIQWAKSNNSLCIIQWDEDNGTTGDHIPTIFAGANVKVGTYSETINHYNVLRTIEDTYGTCARRRSPPRLPRSRTAGRSARRHHPPRRPQGHHHHPLRLLRRRPRWGRRWSSRSPVPPRARR